MYFVVSNIKYESDIIFDAPNYNIKMITPSNVVAEFVVDHSMFWAKWVKSTYEVLDKKRITIARLRGLYYDITISD